MARTGTLVDYPDLSDKVYEIIKEEILSAKTPPGARLHIAELANRLGVSRTPVVEALNRLMAEGLVRDVQRKGYFVCGLDAQDISDLLDARLLLEFAAAERSISSAGPEFIAEMWRRYDAIEKVLSEHPSAVDQAEMLKWDCEFHLLIVSSLRNRRLVEFYHSLYLQLYAARIHLATKVGYRMDRETQDEHRAIVEAFASGSLAAVKAAIAAHLEGIAEWFRVPKVQE